MDTSNKLNAPLLYLNQRMLVSLHCFWLFMCLCFLSVSFWGIMQIVNLFFSKFCMDLLFDYGRIRGMSIFVWCFSLRGLFIVYVCFSVLRCYRWMEWKTYKKLRLTLTTHRRFQQHRHLMVRERERGREAVNHILAVKSELPSRPFSEVCQK